MSESGRIENEIVLHGRRNNQAWFEPSIGVIPARDGARTPKCSSWPSF